MFAWPLVMSATVFTAQTWSVVLKEFDGAPRAAKRWNEGSLCLLVSSVVVVAVPARSGEFIILPHFPYFKTRAYVGICHKLRTFR